MADELQTYLFDNPNLDVTIKLGWESNGNGSNLRHYYKIKVFVGHTSMTSFEVNDFSQIKSVLQKKYDLYRELHK